MGESVTWEKVVRGGPSEEKGSAGRAEQVEEKNNATVEKSIAKTNQSHPVQ